MTRDQQIELGFLRELLEQLSHFRRNTGRQASPENLDKLIELGHRLIETDARKLSEVVRSMIVIARRYRVRILAY
jgi:hypothetical protein